VTPREGKEGVLEIFRAAEGRKGRPDCKRGEILVPGKGSSALLKKKKRPEVEHGNAIGRSVLDLAKDITRVPGGNNLWGTERKLPPGGSYYSARPWKRRSPKPSLLILERMPNYDEFYALTGKKKDREKVGGLSTQAPVRTQGKEKREQRGKEEELKISSQL